MGGKQILTLSVSSSNINNSSSYYLLDEIFLNKALKEVPCIYFISSFHLLYIDFIICDK